jgi:hypothetical protein
LNFCFRRTNSEINAHGRDCWPLFEIDADGPKASGLTVLSVPERHGDGSALPSSSNVAISDSKSGHRVDVGKRVIHPRHLEPDPSKEGLRMSTPWLSIATRVQVKYPDPADQGPMKEILGAVLHTTNTSDPHLTIEKLQTDWQAQIDDPRVVPKNKVCAHFVVEKGGRIGQFRALNIVAWRIDAPSRQYIGIEHSCQAHLGDHLEKPQIARSAELLRALSSELKFPLRPLKGPGSWGVGVHQQFGSTPCGGHDVFWHGDHASGKFVNSFWEILQVPTGRWEVHVGAWTWIYIFDGGSSVEWQKLNVVNPLTDTGYGTWLLSDKLRIFWKNDSLEEWKIPLACTTTGTLTRQAGDDTITAKEREITAKRLDCPCQG